MGKSTIDMNGLRRLTGSLFRPPFSSIAVVAIFLVGLTTISALLDIDSPSTLFTIVASLHWKSLIAFVLLFLAGGATGILFSGIAQSGWTETASCFWVSMRRTYFWFVIVAFFVVCFLIWLGSAWVNSGMNRFALNFHDPGGIFAAWMGLITILGFAFTLHDLREMRRRITTFSELVDSLVKMVSVAARNGEVVRFLAYTPALGYIALEDNEFQEFYKSLHILVDGKGPPVEMICLSEKDLREWHNLFIGRQTRRKKFDDGASNGKGADQRPSTIGEVDQNLATAATKKGESILTYVANEAQNAGDPEPRVKRLPFEFLPGYYFFLSSNRAIVVAPLQLPFPKGAPKNLKLRRGTVQMLGFETNDRAIIRDLSDLYESYKVLPSTYIAEYSESMSPEEFEGWCNHPHFREKAIQSMLAQYNEAKGPDAPVAANGESLTRYKEYSSYFRDGQLDKTKLELTLRVSVKQTGSDG